MTQVPSQKNAWDAYREGTDYQFDQQEILLGPWTSYSLVHDPKHMSFVLARYKFCAKMLQGKGQLMEIGSGDGFGLPIIAQAAEHVHCVDWDPRLLEGIQRRLPHLKNVSFHHIDLNERHPGFLVDAAYSIDVIEHIEPEKEAQFMESVIRCLKPGGVLITGTPNITASAYASPRSQVQHINLKSMETLRSLNEGYFENTFMFGMNDEVVHTGYAPMCHYIWALGVGLRPEYRGDR